jgi:ribonuclease BN (tRNA processing enzyme)
LQCQELLCFAICIGYQFAKQPKEGPDGKDRTMPVVSRRKAIERLGGLAVLAVGATVLPAGSRIARGQAGQPSKVGTRVITLGTQGGPFPQVHRAQSSNLLLVNDTPYIIDAGDGVVRRLAKGNFSTAAIGTIFLTHLHDDHTSGLGTLMSVAWDQNRTIPINVYGPPRTEELVKAAIQYFSISAEIRIDDGGRTVPLRQVFFGHDVGTGLVFQDANIKVTAVENSHFDFHKDRGKHKSYSYRFETPDRVIVFTGDTGQSDALAELAKGADLLFTETNTFEDRKEMMIESGQWQRMTESEREGLQRQGAYGHMTQRMLGEMAARANVKTVVLTHLTYSPSGNYERRAEEVRKYFSGPVILAKDLMEF